VGNASGAPMHDVSGVSGAAPIWRRLMLALHEGGGWGAPAPPPGLVSRQVQQAEGGKGDEWRGDGRTEWFLAGTEMAVIQRASHSADAGRGAAPAVAETQPPTIAQRPGGARPFGITHPQDGSVFALDPDIPPASQRLVFEGAPGRWVLNGKPLGKSARLSWSLWPGRHRLEWTAADGSSQQVVHFEVRGAGIKPAAARQAAHRQLQP
jgi:penicillin-binding protein 1C